ncbi:MAG TPA: Rieske 2Fe-2S domain-containing protein [Phenylobacterium sp.]|uniref:Rieske 2Fe-2S domain-containing protein n=1 Tax=Phenylobacterium sp. TaxID=1871053 RepID=UPI002B46D096|nr:Rieske 2Fe-2S domain-containing protein [Phenylobacterium sp.]HKR88254.1 Rieske 2Fe-2S domain-containing protein [Phenylobacterium sp.]
MDTDTAHACRRWPTEDGRHTPYRVFTDPDVYTREQERIFRGKTWSFVALEAEIPNVGDFKSTYVGDTPVVVTRGKEGVLHAWVNRCAHRGAKVCRQARGNARDFTCIYHQWAYGPAGDLLGVPFRRGLKSMSGMPADFDMGGHGLQKLRVETYRGLVFVTFSDETEPLETYLGAEMLPWIDRVFCKPVVFLGVLRQRMNSNWKLYFENIKDPYHGHLLHLFHNTFNIGRPNMDVANAIDARHGLHSIIAAIKNEASKDTSIYKDNRVTTFKDDVRLQDPEIVRMRTEFDLPVTNHIQSIFPSLVIQQIHNTLACRQILPRGPGSFELVFHLFGYEDDDDELRDMRILQANLVGPAGFISMEDGEATELVQAAVTPDPNHESTMLMGYGAPEGARSLITEQLLRSFWSGYRAIMGD